MNLKRMKGQSALEYLMTYGWALIVIVVVIAALVVLVPKPAPSCTGFQKLTITNQNLTTTGLQITVLNQTGRSLTNVDFNANFGTQGTASSTGNTFSVGETKTISFNTPLSGQVKADLTVSYNDGQFVKTETGSCSGSL
ncbi:MAG: hypothetical protein QXS90_00265 [Candidatus Diapherotrites archaeon]